MNKVFHYNIYGKQVLKPIHKYYATDLGVKANSKNVNYSQCFENIVYNELIKTLKCILERSQKVKLILL